MKYVRLGEVPNLEPKKPTITDMMRSCPRDQAIVLKKTEYKSKTVGAFVGGWNRGNSRKFRVQVEKDLVYVIPLTKKDPDAKKAARVPRPQPVKKSGSGPEGLVRSMKPFGKKMTSNFAKLVNKKGTVLVAKSAFANASRRGTFVNTIRSMGFFVLGNEVKSLASFRVFKTKPNFQELAIGKAPAWIGDRKAEFIRDWEDGSLSNVDIAVKYGMEATESNGARVSIAGIGMGLPSRASIRVRARVSTAPFFPMTAPAAA